MTTVEADPRVGRPSSSLHYAVGELSGKVDAIRTDIIPVLASLGADIRGLDSRVSALEVWQGRILGGGSVVIFLIGSWEVLSRVIHK